MVITRSVISTFFVLTIVSSEADGAVLQPLQVEERLVGPHLLPGLHPAPGLQGEVLVLHGAYVPPACHTVKLELECFMVGYFFLVSSHINTCYSNTLYIEQ